MPYPSVLDADPVGSYPASAKAGGGYVWDEEAMAFADDTPGAEAPLALILQREYIDEPENGIYLHVKEERLTEWPVVLLSRPRRTDFTIPDFLSPTAPANRLDILRGL